jgi:hypothetical protein
MKAIKEQDAQWVCPAVQTPLDGCALGGGAEEALLLTAGISWDTAARPIATLPTGLSCVVGAGGNCGSCGVAALCLRPKAELSAAGRSPAI